MNDRQHMSGDVRPLLLWR